ncbi:hypothetical protein A2707_02430 [Candidatus Saccharibacteria bacterium RIFCSPHIGHO2_01_FULL_45_15]|nr:MAG: hypothetical protein A2707_02430 [Candidatus Saccharibacteria bacterium RIFCSPHIGHO2_01_FULL_45_15]OGL28752.1 MAG: hypothetical protein A3C39_00265 [Candidatus Saccharibacteria bacterium RIFCSPHIGHO2_02_FULL_46_12]OGL31786.1 MAG: hypothetical protein A3E76_03025 [Candidatus Saccharibacteria bacterium RIFCSPHIGHO2_12_FULL_44_22]
MFMKSPEFQPVGDMIRHPTTVSEYDESRRKQRLHETKLGQNWDKLGRTRRFLAKSAIYGSMSLLPFGAYLKYDVLPEYERLANTHPEVIDVYEANDPADSNTKIYGIMGLGNISAEETMTTLDSLADIGDVKAIKLDNQGIDITVIADKIKDSLVSDASDVEGAEMTDYTVGFFAGSMGGEIVPKVALDLRERYEIKTEFVLFDCSPFGLDSVRPEHREKGLQLMKYLPVAEIVGGDVARSVRFPVEMVARKERYMTGDIPAPWMIDVDEFIAAFKEVYVDKILKKDVASGRFIAEQVGQIKYDDAIDSLNVLNEIDEGGDLLSVIYMRPFDPNQDTVVDVSLGQRLVTATTNAENRNLLIAKLHNTGHANPNQRPSEYNEVIQNRIIPFLERRESEKAISDLAYLAIAHSDSHLAILDPDE